MWLKQEENNNHRKDLTARETCHWPLYRAVSCEMGGKKRKKAQSTDTSDTFGTAEQRRSMEVSDSIMEKLKKWRKKWTKTNCV